jgi:malonyl-CoA/methylmalonyl-CoA synthetase
MEDAFDEEGYFITGDVAEFNAELNSYRILGRASVDILKIGGYKLSALEIERDLLEHPDIAEIAIVGVPDKTWGERVGMICRTKTGSEELTIDSLRIWCGDRIARHKIPSRLLIVNEIPKNAMGKVNKKTLAKLFETKND